MYDGHLIIKGDFNCPGMSKNAVEALLDTWLSCCNLVTISVCPMIMNCDGGWSRLNLIIEPVPVRCLSTGLTPPSSASKYSGHRLVTAQLLYSRSMAKGTTYCYRGYWRMNASAFRNSFQASVAMTSPPMDLDNAVCKFDVALLSTLYRHAPLCTRTKWQDKSGNHWLSPRQPKQKEDVVEQKDFTRE